ncbi:MAG: hypothetical protein ACLQSR_02465 [Limisphaerales bacterium]
MKRYQLQHGSYPTNLSALVPEFLPDVPRDPVDGQPLRYRANANGTFLLYSIGPNAKDDGGDPIHTSRASPSLFWQNPDALDWVWPQPARPEEVENYYKHRPN